MNKATKRKAQGILPAKTSPSTSKGASSNKKRKLEDNNQDQSSQSKASPSSRSKPKTKANGRNKSPTKEKRLLRWRSAAPQTFLSKLARAQTQRMIVVGRTRSGSDEDMEECIDIVGSTGNIYQVTISREPSCTCPDHAKGNECKHKVYALHTVLKAPYELQYQRALLTTELEEIFANAPAIPFSDQDGSGKRKPIEGECPICYMDLDPDENELVWCKAACGNNIHKSCFDQWAASSRTSGVKCVYCRAPWEVDRVDLEILKRAGENSGDGYVNVAEHFGINRARDYSTYHQPWARRTFGYGG